MGWFLDMGKWWVNWDHSLVYTFNLTHMNNANAHERHVSNPPWFWPTAPICLDKSRLLSIPRTWTALAASKSHPALTIATATWRHWQDVPSWLGWLLLFLHLRDFAIHCLRYSNYWGFMSSTFEPRIQLWFKNPLGSLGCKAVQFTSEPLRGCRFWWILEVKRSLGQIQKTSTTYQHG